MRQLLIAPPCRQLDEMFSNFPKQNLDFGVVEEALGRFGVLGEFFLGGGVLGGMLTYFRRFGGKCWGHIWKTKMINKNKENNHDLSKPTETYQSLFLGGEWSYADRRSEASHRRRRTCQCCALTARADRAAHAARH